MRRFLGPLIVIAVLAGIFALVATDLLSGGFADEFDELSDRTTDEALTLLDESEGFANVQVFDVLADGSLEPEADGRAAEAWDIWLKLAGADSVASMMTQYRVGEAPQSPTLAYVYQDQGIRQFTLALNLSAADDDVQLVSTLVHEWSHVVSLSVDQFEPDSLDGDGAGCETLALVHGCLTQDSYLWNFYESYWSDYAKHPEPESYSVVIAEEFFAEHQDDFVSAYAATNVLEDFAETFTVFVIANEGDVQSGLGAAAVEKLDFFEQYPELVQLREQMRAGAAAELAVL